MEIEKITKTPVAPSLKTLSLYKTVNFSLTQYAVVAATIQRITTETGMRFTQKKNKATNFLEVTRIA